MIISVTRGCCQLVEGYELSVADDLLANIGKYNHCNILAATNPKQENVHANLIAAGFRPIAKFPSHYGYYDILWLRMGDLYPELNQEDLKLAKAHHLARTLDDL